MLERYGHCAKHGGTCNNRANKPDFLRHNVLLLDCRTLERISSTGPATNHSGIEGKRVLSDVCSRKSGHKPARPVLSSNPADAVCGRGNGTACGLRQSRWAAYRWRLCCLCCRAATLRDGRHIAASSWGSWQHFCVAHHFQRLRMVVE